MEPFVAIIGLAGAAFAFAVAIAVFGRFAGWW
jgi:hypothetical protein